MNQKIGVLGCGNMGGAIVEGLLKKVPHIYVYDRNPINRKRMQELPNVTLFDSAKDLSRNIDVLIIAIKPESVCEALQQLEQIRTYNQVISVSDKITLEQITEVTSTNVIRTIPNTAAAINMSTTISTGKSEIMELLGTVIIIPEDKFGSASILSGCQPAFIMKYVRAAQQAGIELGLTAQQSQELTIGAITGSMELLKNGGTPDLECNKVMSPGGITVKGVNKLEELGFAGAIIQSLKACK